MSNKLPLYGTRLKSACLMNNSTTAVNQYKTDNEHYPQFTEDDNLRSKSTEENFESFQIIPYLLTSWLAYLYGRMQSPRPDVITRAPGFGFACIDTQAN